MHCAACDQSIHKGATISHAVAVFHVCRLLGEWRLHFRSFGIIGFLYQKLHSILNIQHKSLDISSDSNCADTNGRPTLMRVEEWQLDLSGSAEGAKSLLSHLHQIDLPLGDSSCLIPNIIYPAVFNSALIEGVKEECVGSGLQKNVALLEFSKAT